MSLAFLDSATEPDLVYREVSHMQSLVFAPPEVALRLDLIHEAIRARTWGEFKYLMPEDKLEKLISERNAYYDEELDDDFFKAPEIPASFEFEQLCPAYLDGDYPEWLQKKQEYWLPKEVIEKWGRLESSILNGDFWVIHPEHEKKIVKDLVDLNKKIEKREDLFFY